MDSYEYYLKYWKIVNPDGSITSPERRESDAVYFEILEIAQKLNIEPFTKLKFRTKERLNSIIREILNNKPI